MGRFLACEHAILLSRVEQAKSNPSCAIRCPVLLWCLRILWIPFRNFVARLDVVAASKFLCIMGFGTELLYPVAMDLRCKMRLEARTTSMQKTVLWDCGTTMFTLAAYPLSWHTCNVHATSYAINIHSTNQEGETVMYKFILLKDKVLTIVAGNKKCRGIIILLKDKVLVIVAGKP